jgi:TRAP-type C4-dicarboxylate transport system permease small subunit
VKVDFLIERVPAVWRKAMGVFTRLLGAGMFVIFGWRLFVQADKFSKAGQTTPILELPDYPVVYAVGVCCFFVSVVLLVDLVRTLKEETV